MSMVPLNFEAELPLRLKPHFVHVMALSRLAVPQFGQNTLVPSACRFTRECVRSASVMDEKGKAQGITRATRRGPVGSSP